METAQGSSRQYLRRSESHDGAASRRPSPDSARDTSGTDVSASTRHATFAAAPKRTTFDVEDPEPTESSLSNKVRQLVDRFVVRHNLAWVRQKSTWAGWRPVIRCAVAAWLGMVIQLIVPAERAIGYAAFFVLVVAFLCPPHQPAIQSLEVYFNLFFFCGIAWAWSCLGIFIADQVRPVTDPARVAEAEARWAYLAYDPAAYQRKILFEGTYIEAAPSVVCSIFLAVGTGALLWYKLRTQPSPATFPLVLSCILLDISLTTAAYYPYALYTSGLLFFLPMAIQAGLGCLSLFVIFPESVAHSYQAKFAGVINPLSSALGIVESLFESEGADDLVRTVSVGFDTWVEQGKRIRGQLLASLAGLPPLRAQQRYLRIDISYGRLSGKDLRQLGDKLAVVQTRSTGVAFFFDVIINNSLHTHLDSTAFSVHEPQSRPNSRPASIAESSRDGAEEGSPPAVDTDEQSPTPKRFHLHFLHRPVSFGHKGSHVSLLEQLRKVQQPVGVYESQKYMDVERVFAADQEDTLAQMGILASSAVPLVRTCRGALEAAGAWIIGVNKDRHLVRNGATCGDLKDHIKALEAAIQAFGTARLAAIKPYRHIFDPAHPAEEHQAKAHYRGLFQGFVAQYHMIEFSQDLLSLVRLMAELDETRLKKRFWYPRPSKVLKHFRNTHRERPLMESEEGHDNHDGGFESHNDDFLGEVKRRDPEYTPFDSPWLNLLARASKFFDALGSKSLMYAIKAAILGGLTTLPAFISSSAGFYYYNRGVWCTIMAQLTLAVYAGDTTSAWIGRIVASSWGCLVGTVAWYIGSGSGLGNPYGLGAVTAVLFPLAMYFRLHFPGQVLVAAMTPVTMGLVIGYSYLNGTLGQLTDAGVGWSVAWRRLVCVLIGITAAWLFSFFPPSFSGKKAIRYSYAQTIAGVGNVLCDILSDANDYHNHIHENMETRQKVLTWRTKLNKLGVRHANAAYEYSIRGRWPEERYKALLDALQDAMSLLAQLNHVLPQLDRPWRKALLDRTRLSDLGFLGEVLAVITMCSSGLRSGTPLPQITPSPLVARFRLGKTKGVDLPADPHDHTGELPSLVTVEVLESENYMRYALGITTVFSLLSRLDRIVVICKTLLGENYHISGVHLEHPD